MITVDFSDRARGDLDEIWLRIAHRHPLNADRFHERLRPECMSLGDLPDAGSPRPVVGLNVRSKPVDNYVIFYVSGPDCVQIIRVLHGSRLVVDLEEP